MIDKEEKNKVWIDEGGILVIKIAKILVSEDAFKLISKGERFLVTLGGRGRILIEVLPGVDSFSVTSEFRKTVSMRLKEIVQNPGFERVAILGATAIIRMVGSFIVSASGIENIKIFREKEKALEWLKNK